MPEEIEACKLEPNCPICDPILHDHKSSSNGVILFPHFRRVEDDIYLSRDFEANGDSRDDSKSSPTPELQKLVSSLMLSDLLHTLEFIQNYNSGMIVSTKKRR